MHACIFVDIYAVQVNFQATSLSVPESDNSITFTLEISGDIDPASTTTVHISAFDDSASKCIAIYSYS